MRRVGIHVLLLAVVLGAAVAVIGVDGVVSADESAMLAELDQLDAGRGWVEANPEPVVDPTMQVLPLPIADRTVAGDWAPFAKHPAHVAVLQPLWGLGGYGATLGLSVLGVVLAAAAGAALGERLRPGIGPLVVWSIGLGSPLAFDVHQVVGHALGAGLFGAAVLLAVRSVEGSSLRLAPAAAAAAAVGAGVLVRSEAVLAGLALGAALGLGGLLRRHRPAIATGAACGAAALAARLVEPRLIRAVLGAERLPGISGRGDDVGGLAGRWSAFRITVLDAGYPGGRGAPLLHLALAVGVAAFAVWRWRADERAYRVLAVAATVLTLLWLARSDFLVPGLLPALPVLALGVVAALAAGRPGLAGGHRAELWGAAALFVAAVSATQYERGGGGEWGGRYFAIAIPLLVPLAWVALADATAAMPVDGRRLGAAALAVISLALTLGAWREVGDARRGSADSAASVLAAVDRLDVDVTISTRPALSRFAWPDVLDGRRWFTVDHGDLDLTSLSGALAGEADVDRVALVTADVDGDVANLDSGWHVEQVESGGGPIDVVLLVR